MSPAVHLTDSLLICLWHFSTLFPPLLPIISSPLSPKILIKTGRGQTVALLPKRPWKIVKFLHQYQVWNRIPPAITFWVPSLHVWSVILSWQLDQTRCDTCLMIFFTVFDLSVIGFYYAVSHNTGASVTSTAPHISFNPVCASDGRSYDKPCQVKEASCQRQERIEVKFRVTVRVRRADLWWFYIMY